MHRSRSLLVASIAVGLSASLFFGACVGEEAPTTSAPGTDGGGTTPQPEGSAPTPDGSMPEAATDGETPMDGGGTTDGGYDGGAPAWTATLPAGTVTETVGPSDTHCRFSIVTVMTSPAPPKYTVHLRKDDAPGGTCNEPKGLRVLGDTYAAPNNALLKPPTLNRLLVAYGLKGTQSGSSPTVLTIKQVDWVSGNDMRQAQMKTKAIQGQPMNVTLGVTNMFFGDQTESFEGTIRVDGTGAFPGATGTGAKFHAVWTKFMGDTAQPAAAADSATLSD